MEINLCLNCMKEKPGPGPCPYCGFEESACEAAPHLLPLGTILAGKYLIGRMLGEGGFGITYVGWDLNLEVKVAIKEYYPSGIVTRDNERSNTLTAFTGQRAEFFQKGLDRFVEEARRLGRFWGLPGIVSVKDYFQENKTAYIVMEYAEGRTLKEILKQEPQGRLGAEQVFSMLKPVLEALKEVHQSGLIHRDISPDNLMVSPEGQVKLIDFGAARSFLAEGEKSLSVMLKPGYAPEEQYRSRGNQGPWTDVYGLCATMYRAITGQVPEEALDRMEEDSLKSPSALGISIEPWQEAALMKGLAIRRKDRFQSMKELEAALYIKPEEALKKESSKEEAPEKKVSGEEQPQEKPSETERTETVLWEPPQKRETKANPKLLAAVGGLLAAVLIACIAFSGGAKDGGEGTTAEHKQSEEPGMEKPSGEVLAEEPEETPEFDENEPVVWTDNNLERMVREGLGKPDGEILRKDLADIQVLRIADSGVAIYESEAEDGGALDTLDYDGVKNTEAITSLEDLKYFPALRVLQINGHQVTDISVLAGLTSLTDLDLYNNEITDIRALADLTSLTDLRLWDNKISDISALSGLTSLTHLNVRYNEIADISALSELTSLTNLDLGANVIIDISALSGLTSLTNLDLSVNAISDISALSGLTALANLDLEENEISDISVLSGLTALTNLNLAGTEISDISALSGLTSLTDLNLSHNEISDISALSGLTSLTELDLGFNFKITDISALSSLGNLEILKIKGLNITTLSPLSGLSKLRILNISEDWEGDTSCLDGIEGLEITSDIYL